MRPKNSKNYLFVAWFLLGVTKFYLVKQKSSFYLVFNGFLLGSEPINNPFIVKVTWFDKNQLIGFSNIEFISNYLYFLLFFTWLKPIEVVMGKQC